MNKIKKIWELLGFGGTSSKAVSSKKETYFQRRHEHCWAFEPDGTRRKDTFPIDGKHECSCGASDYNAAYAAGLAKGRSTISNNH